ncbi:MAG: hypothetical protein JWO32_470 [Bacteroidetes bacterium]|nr:hypothetical protein [Bacteroidota bacterium]
MKKTFFFLSVTFLIAFAACKTVSYAKTIDKYDVSTQQTEIAKKRWAESDGAKLIRGKSIFTKQCTECHKAFVIEKFSERKWNHEIDDMSPKAKLSPEEKQDLTYFVLSYLEMKQAPK